MRKEGSRHRCARGLGALGGIALGVIVLAAADRLDSRIRTKEEAEQSFRLPVLAEVPPLEEGERSGHHITVAESPLSVVAEAYRGVQTSVLSVMRVATSENGESQAEDGGMVVMVVSAGPEEGKTTSVANLGAVFAEGGSSTLVFNADYRRPRLQQFFPGSRVEVTTKELGGLGGGRAVETGIEGVKLVTGIGEGQKDPNPAAVVSAQRKVIELARRYFEVVIVDTAPLLVTNDAARLIGDVDVVLVVGRAGMTTREQARAGERPAGAPGGAGSRCDPDQRGRSRGSVLRLLLRLHLGVGAHRRGEVAQEGSLPGVGRSPLGPAPTGPP